MFTATFVITEECNNNCEYCYMKNMKRYMDPDTFDYHYINTLPLYMKHYKENKYILDLFGGEPTLNRSLVEHIVKTTNKDTRLKQINLITNGLLLDQEWIKFIKDNNINPSISFDGLWENNIKQYLTKTDIFRQVVDRCSVCVTPNNLNMSDNYSFIKEEFGLFPSFKIVRDDIWTQDDVYTFKKELNKLMKTFTNDIKEMKQIMFPFRALFKVMVEATQKTTISSRCHAGSYGAAFSYDKNVYPCARFLTDKRYNLKNDILFIDKKAKKYSTKCLECEIFSVCPKMCIHQELKNGVITNLCEIYKMIIDSAIEINHSFKNFENWREFVRNG